MYKRQGLDRQECRRRVVEDLERQGLIERIDDLSLIHISRCEYRLLLRHDNADLRLTEKGYRLGLIDKEHYEIFREKERLLQEEKERLESLRLTPSDAVNKKLISIGSSVLSQPQTLAEILKRPEIKYADLDGLTAGQDLNLAEDPEIISEVAVSYTHLDVYKRQVNPRSL